MKANDTQVGGDHYKTGGIQHWDLITEAGVGYLEGCATKYVTRWRKKNGIADLKKAAHYVQKIREVNSIPTWAITQDRFLNFLRDNDIGEAEGKIIWLILMGNSDTDLQLAANGIASLIAQHSAGTPEDGGHHK